MVKTWRGFYSRFGEPPLHSASWALIRRNRNLDLKSFCQDSVVRPGQNTRLLMGTTEKPNVIHKTTSSETSKGCRSLYLRRSQSVALAAYWVFYQNPSNTSPCESVGLKNTQVSFLYSDRLPHPSLIISVFTL